MIGPQELFHRGQKGSNNMNKKKKISEKSKHFKDLHRQREQPKPQKKRLLLHETPMNERPQCKFYMEGKCQKVSLKQIILVKNYYKHAYCMLTPFENKINWSGQEFYFKSPDYEVISSVL